MRAKMKVTDVKSLGTAGTTEVLKFSAVYKDGAYPADGSDEDNTFAMFTPQAECSMTVTNPALIGKIKVGEKYYVDFTKVGE